MSLDEIGSLDWSQESWWNAAQEISEKFKEVAKKASAWAARTQRDEKKAKRYDFFLSSFLVKMILEKKYDSLLEKVFYLLNKWYPSNFVLSVVSLVYMPISVKIREEVSKKTINELSIKKQEFLTDFKDFEIDEEIKKRINIWIEDIIDAIWIDSSSIVSKKLQELIQLDSDIKEFISETLIFYLLEYNYLISKEKSLSFASFITNEIKKLLNMMKIEEI